MRLQRELNLEVRPEAKLEVVEAPEMEMGAEEMKRVIEGMLAPLRRAGRLGLTLGQYAAECYPVTRDLRQAERTLLALTLHNLAVERSVYDGIDRYRMWFYRPPRRPVLVA
jgi:hypothetical protein